MRRHRLANGLRFLLLGIAANTTGCEEPFDWCTELKDDGTLVKARGAVSITYKGKFAPSGTVKITPVVRYEGSTLTVQGCGRKGGDLWRWRGGFGGIVPGAHDTVLTADEEGPGYAGEVVFCEDATCTFDEKKYVVRTSSDMRPAEGVVHTWEPTTGAFSASLHMRNGLDEPVSIEVDIEWDPP